LDSITIHSTDFVNNIKESNIISVGKLTTLYSDFVTYINDYFGYANGFSALFNLSSQVNIHSGIFNANAFINIINGQTLNQSTGEYVNDLSGSVTVNYINNLLNYVVYSNPFNNRNPSDNNGAGYSIQDGFIEGDLIFIPNGITITLNVIINNNNITLNNLGSTFLSNLNANTNYVNGYFSSSTNTTNTNIQRVFKAPLLIKLMNLS